MTSTDFSALLSEHAQRATQTHLRELAANSPQRASAMALKVGDIYANFARQKYDDAAWQALIGLANTRQLPQAFATLFAGHTVNVSENRAALHTALRGALTDSASTVQAHAQSSDVRQQMNRLRQELVDSPVTDIINVGIGGSDLGPRLAVDALRDSADHRFRVHFLSNVDGHAAAHLLNTLDPAKTAAILVSKSFSTQETLLNGSVLKQWLGGPERLYVVSAKPDKAQSFGVPPARVLPMWDWVGGRYSLWSAVGFSIQLALGADNFDALLRGAADMDAHALNAPIEQNLPIRHALTAIWNTNALGAATQAILPYDDRLRLLPSYLQQLVMESLGKRVGASGDAIANRTVPVIWGGPGTDSQHSFFQALHQGTQTVPADFIGVIKPSHDYTDNHLALLSNLLAQTQALASGESSDDPHRHYPGDRPSTMFLLDQLTPRSFGALIAMYEHSVYAQAVLWGINAFDQWGVELGKKLANQLLPVLSQDASASHDDAVTAALLMQINAMRDR